MMLLKCCTHYIGKFGKLSNSHRTGKGQFGKGQFSFQFQRKAIAKNSATTVKKLCLFYILTSLCLKFSKLALNMNQKLPDVQAELQGAEEPQIKLTTFIESWKKQRNSKETSNAASLTMLKPLTGWIRKTVKNS